MRLLLARRDTKAFFSNQCKEIEENNRMGKTRDHSTSLVAQMVKRLSIMWETQIRSLGWEDPPEKEMATHSSILASKDKSLVSYSPWVGKIPRRRERLPTPGFWLEDKQEDLRMMKMSCGCV